MRILCLLLIFVSLSTFANTVRITDPGNLVVTGTTVSSFTLNSESPGTDSTTAGTAEGSPAKVYVPLTNAFANHDRYFKEYRGGVTTLFDTTNTGHVINFPLKTTVTGTMYLYAAAKISTGTGYKIVQRFSSSLSGTQDVVFGLSPKFICDQYTSDCTIILPTVGTNTSKLTFKIYFFPSATSNLALGDTMDPAATTGGVFFETAFSNRIYESTQVKVSITDVRKGDARIILDYTSDNSILDFKKILIFNHTAAPGTVNAPVGDALYTGNFINRDFSTNPSGEVTINELVNGTPATLSVAFEDKYGFVTTLSDDVTETPIEIQELLKKQACYILTAGFGEEHYITNFFREYRDQVLVHTWLGKKFIELYYKTAPHYALIIYKNEVLRSSIRAAAYGIYFLFNYYWAVLLLFSLAYLVIKQKKLE